MCSMCMPGSHRTKRVYWIPWDVVSHHVVTENQTPDLWRSNKCS